MFQPYTTDVTIEGLKRARNAMRLRLWNDEVNAHSFLCHPHRECKDGCDGSQEKVSDFDPALDLPGRWALYTSDLET